MIFSTSFPVIAFEIHFFDLGDQRISRVRARALVVERLVAHFVERRKEFLLVHAVIFDGLFDADALFELFDRFDQYF